MFVICSPKHELVTPKNGSSVKEDVSGFSGLIYEGLYTNSMSSMNWMTNKHKAWHFFFRKLNLEGSKFSWRMSCYLGWLYNECVSFQFILSLRDFEYVCIISLILQLFKSYTHENDDKHKHINIYTKDEIIPLIIKIIL